MPEPKHDEALVNLYLERFSALSVSAFDGADVSGELDEVAREVASRSGADSDTLSVLASRLRERAEAAEREGQPLVRDTFARAANLIASK
jgi:hypothetical protein